MGLRSGLGADEGLPSLCGWLTLGPSLPSALASRESHPTAYPALVCRAWGCSWDECRVLREAEAPVWRGAERRRLRPLTVPV